jgi:hypothetical protein
MFFHFDCSETNKESLKATEMLKESIERLNINIPNSDFRKNASNVIAAMLEARMNKQQPNIPSRPLKKLLPPKPQPQSILKKTSNQVDPEFLPPPPPILLEETTFQKTIDSNCKNDRYEKDEFPLPPPPSILTPPLSSDENDLPQISPDKSNGIEKVNLRNKKYHHNNGHNHHQSSVGFNDVHPSVINGNKPELSSHARDRRSYIEKMDNQISNVEGDELNVSKIANGIAIGQHPVCDKCKCKITR